MMLSTQINRSFVVQPNNIEWNIRVHLSLAFFSHTQPDVHKLPTVKSETTINIYDRHSEAINKRGFKVIIMILLMLLMFWLRQKKPPIGMNNLACI